MSAHRNRWIAATAADCGIAVTAALDTIASTRLRASCTSSCGARSVIGMSEFTKPILQARSRRRAETRATTAWVWGASSICCTDHAFITEEVWQNSPVRRPACF